MFFNTSNKRHFLTYVNTYVQQQITYYSSAFPFLNLSMFTKEDGITIDNEEENFK